MYSHTATSWAEAEVFFSRFIQVLQIEIEDTSAVVDALHNNINGGYCALCAEKVMV